MAAELRDYDSLQVTGSWATAIGVFDIVDGRIDGEFVSMARDNADFVREHDGHGNNTRVRMHNRGGTLTVTLSASSPTNKTLSNAQKTDLLTENVVGLLTLNDLNGDTVVVASGAYLNMTPVPSFSTARGERAWTWEYADVEVSLGGHDLA